MFCTVELHYVAIVVSEEVKKKSKVIKEAEKCGVHVVSEDFLSEVKSGNALSLIQKHSIASWGDDVSIFTSGFRIKTCQ